MVYLVTAVAAAFVSLIAFRTFHHAGKEQEWPLYEYQPLRHNRSTRLFTLLPAWDVNAPIQGYLHEIDLDSAPDYEGLSYLCGDPSPGHEIYILPSKTSNNRTISRLPVYPNCVAALKVLRNRLTSRLLWVDAISIDQAPTAEKSQQVKLMTEIYEKARRVLVALKADSEFENSTWQASLLFRAVGWLYRLNLLRVYDRDEQADMKMPKPTRLVMACSRYVEQYSKKLGGAFNAPFMNRYFQRVWTVQEIAMARQITIHYGTSIVSWHDFVVAGLFAAKNGGFARNQESKVEIFRDSTVHWDLLNGLESHFVLPDIFSLETLGVHRQSGNILRRYTRGTSELALIKSKALQAFEPKDKAYAMLWAFADDDHGNMGTLFDVNYSKPLEQIYTEFSTAIFVRTKGSTLQFYLINSAPRNGLLPSWVPDWSVSSPMSLFVWTERLRYFHAVGNHTGQYRIGIEGAILQISGVKQSAANAFIRLSNTSRHRDLDHGDTGELIEAILDAAELIRSLIDVGSIHTSYPDESLLLDAVHRVIHSQNNLYESRTEDQMEFHATPYEIHTTNAQAISVGLLRIRVFNEIKFLLDQTSIPLQLVQNALEPLLPAGEATKILTEASSLTNLTPFLAVVVPLSDYYNIYHFLHIIVLDHRDKDLFITEDGTLGMSFQGLKAGDFVALWEGCPSPMIVRQYASVDNQEQGANDLPIFQLHGPAFVDGLMRGEGWPDDSSMLTQFTVI